MKALAAFAGLEGLFDLAEGNGVDMCATLLRVLTDLYLQRPIHTPEDEHYYTELALRLIDATEISERAALAARLASYPSAPKPVLERLARDVIEVAGPILEHSPCPAELKAAAEAGGGAHADTAATRPGSAPQTARAFIGELERMLAVSRPQARRIVNDELGEPIVVAAKAMGLPAEVLQRLLLFWSSWVGQPVDRICELADLYDEISTDAAHRLIAIWREDKRAEDEPVQHEPVAWRAAAENARRTLSEVSRRPDLQHDARSRSGERSECGQPRAAQATI